jgi:2-polyprenyl-3-methyl-5-hydroxy-6-metoxy-1,4-benzoquinol methylase
MECPKSNAQLIKQQMTQSTKVHWNTLYQNKKATEVSWFQEEPTISLALIAALDLEKSAAIIDVGAGDSLLVNFLLAQGYTNITVLDISEKAITKAQKRLGNQAHKVQWIVSDILDFTPKKKFEVWHDRAAFHFITSESDVTKYIECCNKSIAIDGIAIVATFSKTGPKKCSGIPIIQYSETELTSLFAPWFIKQSAQHHEHQTPFETSQDFIFCSFKKQL